MELEIFIVIIVVFFYAIFSKRLSVTILTVPMICLGLGYALSFSELAQSLGNSTLLNFLATLTLIIVLFSDASKTNLSALITDHILPSRMLLVGLPIMIAVGAGVSGLFLHDWSVYALLLVAAILAPTDAALGEVVITNETVPEETRRTLTVESGLNDGLALPFVLLFASFLASGAGELQENFLVFMSKQIVLGTIVGVLVGYLCGKIICWVKSKNFIEHIYETIAAIGVAAGAYLISELLGGNGFISTFVCGLIFGNIVGRQIKCISEFIEGEGQILVWATFLLIGLTLIPNAIVQLSVPMFLMILCSLFIVRPLAIYLSLMSTKTTITDRMFLGWFGPRGLGTALYALLIVGEINTAYADLILSIAINTVWISALLHGVTAVPLANLYGAYKKTGS